MVFGHVISGQEVVKSIANQAVDKHSKPLVSIRISNCGELIPQIKPKGKMLLIFLKDKIWQSLI